jgi:hypothetical protein
VDAVGDDERVAANPAAVADPRETIIAGIGGFATDRFTTPEEVGTLIGLLASLRLGNVTGRITSSMAG